MEEMQKTQQHDYRWEGDERRKQADPEYSGEERRATQHDYDAKQADQQLDQMAKGQQDG